MGLLEGKPPCDAFKNFVKQLMNQTGKVRGFQLRRGHSPHRPCWDHLVQPVHCAHVRVTLVEIVLCAQQSGGEPCATLQGPRQEDGS